MAVAVVVVLSISVMVALYLLKLDERLPQLTLLRAVLLLLTARTIGLATFWIATGSEATDREISPVYQFLVKTISHGGAVVLTGVIGFLLIGAWFACVWRLSSKRVAFAFLVGCAVISLAGAASNLLMRFGIW